jgi:hypothetical protein
MTAKTTYQHLRFRRQFLLSRTAVPLSDEWKCLQIDQYYLYSHPDLEVHRVTGLNKTIVLIGSIFDSATPAKRNSEILNDIFANTNSLDHFYCWIKRYAGIYALLYKDADETILLHDALALREIYYCTEQNRVICGSQPNLLVKYAKPEIGPRRDPDFLEYYAKHSTNSKWNPNYRWIGDETYYDGIKHLLPNHSLDIEGARARRYWPNESLKQLGLVEAVDKSCLFLQGSIRAIADRHSCMMAVTAGTDSRTLLAAARGIENKLYFFVNKKGVNPDRPDISVPQKIFESIGIPFHIHEVSNEVDKEFRQIFLDNTFFASERILPTIYNVYFKNHSEKVNILGIGEIGRSRFGREPKKPDGYTIAYKMKYKQGRYAINQGEKILAELLPVSKEYGLNILTLLYWEHWLGNWGATGNSESDIAIEEIDPYDSHKLYEFFLGVDDKYTNYNNPVIFREMIRKMWPDLLGWPINPPFTFRDKIVKLFKKMGIYTLLKEMKYRWNYLRFRFKASR